MLPRMRALAADVFCPLHENNDALMLHCACWTCPGGGRAESPVWIETEYCVLPEPAFLLLNYQPGEREFQAMSAAPHVIIDHYACVVSCEHRVLNCVWQRRWQGVRCTLRDF